MIDMHKFGAVAFSDGHKSIQSTGLVLRALEYAKTFDGLVIQHPKDISLQGNHMIHESTTSVSLGLPGIPSEAESIMLKRDLDLVNYSKSKICIHNISTKESCQILKKAAKKVKESIIYSSVPVMNLIHTVEELDTFNPLLKVLPPLRSQEDKKALLKAVKADVIDYISSNHRPVDPEHKDLEFFRASFGASTLDTVFSSLLTYAMDELGINTIIDKIAHGPRRVLDLSPNKIEKGSRADLCIFDPSLEYELSSSNIHSKSKNNPYIGGKLKGKVIASVLGDNITLNP
jgi:dihydroorotase